ncbi:aminotransferase class V-fold PLP-dependent enzyme [Streptomyces sp. NPDC046909]|uniref:aminotransferase class V-fold PLP-dependent enzyme n=1 Tax=Streptomyces sp. NPDC046909 TaxID=3155617 RepID=UPI0033F033D2
MDLLTGLLPYDLAEFVRRPVPEQFPGRSPHEHRFDAPGGTLVHGAVADAMSAYLRGPQVANDGGAFRQSRYTDSLAEWARQEVLDLLGAASGSTVFGANMTTLTSLFVRALSTALRPGDEIVCTALDHEANRQPWQTLAASAGARVHVAELRADGELDTEEIAKYLNPRTRWVAVTAASNALGTVPDLRAITEAAHAVGARVYVDAVQATPHRRLDVTDLGCDAVVTSAYKWYGPHLSVLWIGDDLTPDRLRLAEQVPSAGTSGGAQLSLGTQNHEGLVGLAVAARVLRTWPADTVHAEEQRLHRVLVDELRSRPGVRLLADPAPGARRAPVVSFQLAGRTAEHTARALAERNVSVWHGSFYASTALRAVAPERPEAVRAGIAAYTTQDDVSALLKGVDACI